MAATLLIVDDSLLMRQRLRALFSRLDAVEVIGEAENAETALRLCHELRPDIVTLDVSMPDRSGLEVLRDLRSRDPGPRAAILTNFPYSSFRMQSKELGADCFICKSDPPARITAAVEDLALQLETGEGAQ